MASDRPIVTVCIPVYNCEQFIGKAIESVLGQTFHEFELLVVDDASTDRTLEVVRNYTDPRIRVIASKVNRGLAGNWSYGIHESRGKYVKVLCADDLIYSECLKRQVAVLETHREKLALTCCLRDIIDDQGRILFRGHGFTRANGVLPPGEALRRMVRAGRNLIGEPHTVLAAKDIHLRAGDFNPNIKFWPDADMWMRMLRLGSLFVDPTALCAFRVSGVSTSLSWGWKQGEYTRQMLKAMQQMSPETVTSLDYTLGSIRASVDACKRLVLYAYLRRQ